MGVISAIVKRPGAVARRESVENNIESYQALVGGYVEVIPLRYCLMLVNEDGKMLDLPRNFVMSGTPILGTAVFVGNGSEDFADCYYSWQTIAETSDIDINPDHYQECPFCGSHSLKWREECSYSDPGVNDEGDGIVTFYDCENCDCTVEVWKSFSGECE